MKPIALLTAILLAGCTTQYRRFDLPPPTPGPDLSSFQWEVRPTPVIARGPEAWDAVDALNPSVIRYAANYLNLYSGFDGRAWRTGLAESSDGFIWRKAGALLAPDPQTWEGGYIAANGSLLARDAKLWYWYQAGAPPRIALATSPDGRSWQKAAASVLDLGPIGSWDEAGVGDPYVIDAGGKLYLFFVGMDRARRQRLGIAVSGDGLHWSKLTANPILEIGPDGAFDENGLGEPAVWTSNNRYWMLYTGRDRYEVRRIGLAESSDGIHWIRSERAPVLSGDQTWNAKVVCDPTVIPAGDGVHVWFGGGDIARPDERLNGQIGYAFLRAVATR